MGSPGDHGVPTLTHRAARQGLEMPPGNLVKVQVLGGGSGGAQMLCFPYMPGGQGCWPRDPTLRAENSEQGGGAVGPALPSARVQGPSQTRVGTGWAREPLSGLPSRRHPCVDLWVMVRLAFLLHTLPLYF